MRIYDTIMDRAQKRGIVTTKAKEVLDEIRERMKGDIRETLFQRQIRLEREFAALSMQNRSHSDFRSLFEQKVDQMEDAQMEFSKDYYFRQFTTKLTDEIRMAVMCRDWPLVSDGTVHRKPSTWEEVAICVTMVLEYRTDTKAPKDTVNVVSDVAPPKLPPKKNDGGGDGDSVVKGKKFKPLACGNCHKEGHFSYACPSKYSREKGAHTALIAAYKKDHSKVCQLCGMNDHRGHHHYKAYDERSNKDQPRAGKGNW